MNSIIGIFVVGAITGAFMWLFTQAIMYFENQSEKRKIREREERMEKLKEEKENNSHTD